MPEEYVTRLAEDITNVYLSGDAVRVYFIFTEFRSATGNRPVVRRVLPLMPRPAKAGRQWLLEPSATAVLDRLLPLYMTTVVREAFLEADASEHAARMVTMEQAALNCRDMVSSMALTANRLRQARITRELTDIVGTSEALA
jgi:F-type H+-transporting ATPase subunit gamma